MGFEYFGMKIDTRISLNHIINHLKRAADQMGSNARGKKRKVANQRNNLSRNGEKSANKRTTQMLPRMIIRK